MARIIRTFRTVGRVRDGDWVERTKSVVEDEYNVDFQYDIRPHWTPGDVADATLEALQSLYCDHEHSSFPDWQEHGWYSSATYEHMTGEREETTAHLEGFSREESRLVHAKLFGR